MLNWGGGLEDHSWNKKQLNCSTFLTLKQVKLGKMNLLEILILNIRLMRFYIIKEF